MKASYRKHILEFRIPSGTSRGILKVKETWYIIIENDGTRGVGECGILRGLSYDDRPDYEQKLQWVCENIHLGPELLYEALSEFPSIQMGVEVAFNSLGGTQPFELYPSDFVRGKDHIPINGLIWMGDYAFMKSQIEEKLEEGWDCIKLKIGAIDFDRELALLQRIRKEFTAQDIILRVDANGAFNYENDEAITKLDQLAKLDLHSIEQPIMAGQYEKMARLCEITPLPIALDEELIGITTVTNKRNLLQTIQPHYIILKPSLVGGFYGSEQWIEEAEKYNIGWWVTSALESNVGLNAIAQWTYDIGAQGHQGLGTGSLYTNNVSSPLVVSKGKLTYNPKQSWDFNW